MRKETEEDNVFQIARGNPGFLRYSLTRSLIAILPNRDVICEYRTVAQLDWDAAHNRPR
jgi:hypothetical protein